MSDAPCPTCKQPMHQMGCKVMNAPFFWCPYCGTIKPCEHEACAPYLAHEKYNAPSMANE